MREKERVQVSINDLDVNVTLSEYKMRHNKINTSKILDSACGSQSTLQSIPSFHPSFSFPVFLRSFMRSEERKQNGKAREMGEV